MFLLPGHGQQHRLKRWEEPSRRKPVVCLCGCKRGLVSWSEHPDYLFDVDASDHALGTSGVDISSNSKRRSLKLTDRTGVSPRIGRIAA